MNNLIILMSNENDGKGLTVKRFEGMTKGDLFQFMCEHKHARASYLLPETDVEEYIQDVTKLASYDIYDKELSGNDHIIVGELINKTTEATWVVVPLENVVYRLASFIE